jgi:hypothetical protein
MEDIKKKLSSALPPNNNIGGSFEHGEHIFPFYRHDENFQIFSSAIVVPRRRHGVVFLS